LIEQQNGMEYNYGMASIKVMHISARGVPFSGNFFLEQVAQAQSVNLGVALSLLLIEILNFVMIIKFMNIK
jgi:hypothetical protein